DDFGATWTKLTSGLPNEPVNVVCEDPINQNIIYIGTDNGLYISLNTGSEFFSAGKTFPAVAVHDLEVHPTANELIVGTHGRSIYTANVSVLQQFNTSMENKQITLINVKNIRHNPNWGRSWSKWFASAPQPHAYPFFANTPGKLKISISNKAGLLIAETFIEVEKGVGFANYDLTVLPTSITKFNEQRKAEGLMPIEKADDGKYYIPTGTYKIGLTLGNNTDSAEFTVK
ncbi:MAG TPA: glycosyl hydrolase, partial [Bacteroidales bacterium]|nr:glycosyl hydrolase [Bacteroidales bacterium]